MHLRALALVTLLYGLGGWGVNPAAAAELSAESRATIEAARGGAMEKLVLHETPYPAMTGNYYSPDGNTHNLGAYEGRLVVVNFWATWCPPCRHEMPGFDKLAGEMAGDDRVAVITIAHQRDRTDRIEGFLDDLGATNLTRYQDRMGELGRQAGILGLPVTLFLAPDGTEIGRVTGDAVWDGPEARAVIDAMLAELERAGG